MKEIKVKCLSCGSLEGGDFCGGCHTVLPLEEGGDRIDFFEMFNLTPRPYVDQNQLKARFLELSQTLHPDRNLAAGPDAQERILALSAQLNRAYTTLTDTKERLRYLVAEQTDEEPEEAKQVPAEMMELFFEVHDLMQEVDAYLKARRPSASRIVAALESADPDKARLQERIVAMRAQGAERVAVVDDEILRLDDAWQQQDDRAGLLERLGQLADVLSYLGRLHQSLDDKELALQL